MLKQPSSEYRGFRPAGVRLREEMLPQLARLAAGRSRLMLHALHAFDKAQAVMLVEEALLSREHGRAILEALRRMEKDGVEEVRTKMGGGLHSGEQYLIRTLGEEIGGRLHLGRSSGDLSSVGINTLQREKVLRLLEGVNPFLTLPDASHPNHSAAVADDLGASSTLVGRVASRCQGAAGGVGPPRPARSPQGCESGERVTELDAPWHLDDRTRPPRAMSS